jgi:hypothetical protein
MIGHDDCRDAAIDPLGHLRVTIKGIDMSDQEMSVQGRGAAPAVVALAGRRIDAAGAQPPRFPFERIQAVGERVATALRDLNARALVCSAACGADLVALEQAERLGLRRRIVLPFAADRFLVSSVNDRPGDWEAVFKRQVAAAAAVGDLVVLEGKESDERAYAAANEAIVEEAQALARTTTEGKPRRLIALLVWEGKARPGSDATAEFGKLAAKGGFKVESVLTL